MKKHLKLQLIITPLTTLIIYLGAAFVYWDPLFFRIWPYYGYGERGFIIALFVMKCIIDWLIVYCIIHNDK